jgi:tRNA(Ile)-lysidine synthase TilS/MesJ
MPPANCDRGTSERQTALERVATAVARTLDDSWRSLRAPQRARVLVAFSGGLDSTALLLGARAALSRSNVVAAHLDHGLTADSGVRAEAAARTCRELGVECLLARTEIQTSGAGDGIEPLVTSSSNARAGPAAPR